MVTKTNKSSNSSTSKSAPDISSTIKDSAQQIWQAGLGSFSKAQEEGGKVLGSLMKEGLTMQRNTQAAAEEKISETTNKMAGMASEIASKASGQWGKLEGIFEDRVAKALATLGVPTAKDMAALMARVDALSKAAGKSTSKGAGKTPTKAKVATKTPTKVTTKSSAKKAVKTTAKPAAKKLVKRKSA
jgi:poly(hydroxyalkanoate) granule-associated protein